MTYDESGIFIDEARLDAYGESAARSLKLSGNTGGLAVSRELMSCLRTVKEARDAVSRRPGAGGRQPEAYEWLLDNWYLAEREGASSASELKTAGRLRAVEDEGKGSLLTELCRALVRSGRHTVTKKRCEVFLTGFQRRRVLSRKELRFFVPGLKAALIYELAEACRGIAKSEPDEETGKSIGRIFTSLRLLSGIDLSETLERVDRTEQILRQDPMGVYPLMDERTRDHYRKRVSKLARELGVQEHRIAQRVLRLAENGKGETRHVGYHLFTRPLGETRGKSRIGLYIASIVLFTLFLSLCIAFMTESFVAGLLLILPVSELVKSLIDFIILRCVPPRHVPRMELRDGVPVEGRTLCVISALITGPDSGAHFARLLEEYRLANRDAGENLIFGILADLPESKTAFIPGAVEWLKAAEDEITALNAKYGGGFYLFTRRPVLNERDGRYMGWERKRGAIWELALLLNGRDETGMLVKAGTKIGLRGVKYILTLDSDTRLCPGTARELIGAMLHPLNKPVTDPVKRVVTRGFGVISPRMAVELESAGKSDFSRVFAGQGGTDPYGCASGEVYMDLTGRGGFAGKGIIDVGVFLECMEGRIPENTVLSHDMLEGAYLRGGYMGDVELTDCYPSGVLSYYRRVDRWTRGDWQNLPWLFKRGRDFCELDRWKVFDNVRRSLVPPLTFASILTGFLLPSGGLLWAGAAALLAIASRLLLTMADAALSREPDGGRVRYHSAILHGVGGGLIGTALRLIFLPYEAYVCARAAVTALWRMLASHKNLLLWQTAAQTESKRGESVFRYYLEMWPVIPSALVSVFLSKAIIGTAAGIVWLLAPFCALVLSRDRDRKRPPDRTDREYLLDCATEIWSFFETFTTPADNFLPPDNWQEQPPVGLARRTSPTNIGLCLLSALSALDLKLTTEHKAIGVIENVIASVERLPKWKGHLYNWYDTRTMTSLHPKYVSTVDSGNLAGSLITLREGLTEYGYSGLAARCDSLLAPMDFAPLYDSSRRLFYIGWDVEQDEPTEGWYDLLASEARLSGYIAIAKGDVERRHWRRLSRAQVSKDNYRGMASWTGTMFEYLMPELVMPCYRDSLLYESAKFCVYVQKRRVNRSRPWGISESAFYSLDPSLSYRYKAHGCAALALKRGMDKELVISPYSSFLALAVEPKAAIHNLRRLDSLGVRGERFGFWEALDYTPSRTVKAGDGFETVRCVMAHHLGMSLVATANYLGEGIMQKRFMRDPAMSAHAGLLQEKVPIGGILLHRRDRELPDKPARAVNEGWTHEGEGTDRERPDCCLISNGAYHVLLTESGITSSRSGNITLCVSPRRQVGDTSGFALYLLKDGELLPLTPHPFAADGLSYSHAFTTSGGSVSALGRGFESTADIAVSAGEQGELRVVRLSAIDSDLEGEIIMTFEPVLARHSDYVNHPAFYKLGLHSSVKDGSLVIRRLIRGESASECFLALVSDSTASFTANRDQTPGRLPPTAQAFIGGGSDTLGWIPDTQITVRIPIRVEAGKTQSVRLAMCLGSTEDDALTGAQRVLAMGEDERASLPRACAALFGMDSGEIGEAMDMVRYLVYPTPRDGEDTPSPADSGESGREGLWRFGVSGDVPIVCAKVSSARGDNKGSVDFAESLLRQHALITSCGVPFDLVFLTDEGGDYRRPRSTALWDYLRKLGRESFAGIKGGVHFISASLDVSRVIESAVMVVEDGKATRRERGRSAGVSHIPTFTAPGEAMPPVEYEWQPDGSFTFTSIPYRAWGNMLTNGEFGFFATDCGTGHMWYKNARECRVNRWLNDPLAVRGTETLELITRGETRRSLFAAPDDGTSRVTYDLGSAVWERSFDGLTLNTTAFVPLGTNARVLIIELTGETDGRIGWFTELILSGDDSDATAVRTTVRDGVFSAHNPRNPYARDFIMAASGIPLNYTCDRFKWYRGKPDSESGAGLDPCFGAEFTAHKSLVIVCGCDTEEKIRALAHMETATDELNRTREHWRSISQRLTVTTPDESINRLMNGWAQYQALSCRLLGRTSVYQSGGAYGFRDQLQDIINLIAILPDSAREHIISCCAHQFEEGDVQHWWHSSEQATLHSVRVNADIHSAPLVPPLQHRPATLGSALGLDGGAVADKGVRTRCSDDLLWLPWALCEYTDKTGDMSVLAETAAYLKSKPLAPNERERYETPETSLISGAVLDHAKRAADMALERGTGEHGLLLIGTGDWNDGMDAVGAGGRGESVWLTWFASHTLRRFSALLESTGDGEAAARYAAEAETLGRAADNTFSDGQYLRGYYDDGSPLGAKGAPCCEIDSIAQSFSTLCPEAQDERKSQALDNALSRLFDRESGVVKLFDPPFEDSQTSPGYIESYGPGFRENGGQYTHGALWLAMACLTEGRVKDGYDILRALSPSTHDITRYGAEPYVIAADVYTEPGNLGRAGWSWYTGSAGWYFRVVTEELLGLRQRGGKLYIEPRLPDSWQGYSAVWHDSAGERYDIEVRREGVTVRGEPYDGSGIAIAPDKS